MNALKKIGLFSLLCAFLITPTKCFPDFQNHQDFLFRFGDNYLDVIYPELGFLYRVTKVPQSGSDQRQHNRVIQIQFYLMTGSASHTLHPAGQPFIIQTPGWADAPIAPAHLYPIGRCK